MLELPSPHFDRVAPLFDPSFPNSTMVFSTLEGRTPGKVFVNSLVNPTACLVTINFHHTTFIGGTIDQEWLDSTVAELRRTQNVILTWTAQVANSFEPPGVPGAEIDRLEFYGGVLEGPANIPEGHHLQFIDAELLSRCLWQNEILMAYGTTENFLRHGIGVCLMHRDELCSEAYAFFQGAGKFEIGAITHDKYLKQGYAYIACTHLNHICEARGYPTYWSCHSDNAASAATARKLGYVTERTYTFLYYPTTTTR
jgi:RimJ/RimL family protein N-acetyltransferase